MGGEAREVWEQIGNDNWGQSPYWNGYFNERYMPYLDMHYGRHVRTFVELKSGINSFRQAARVPSMKRSLIFRPHSSRLARPQAGTPSTSESADRNWSTGLDG